MVATAIAVAVVVALDPNPSSWAWERVGEVMGLAAGVMLAGLFALTIVQVSRSFGQKGLPGGAVLVMLYETVWAALLALAAADYLRQSPWAVARTLGPIPTPVLWYGALGGVLVSLSAVAERTANGSWRDRWALWHLLRPMIGAALAVVAVVIFQAGILSIGSDPTPKSAASHPDNLSYFIIAFVVGYRETTFRTLMTRLADTLLSSGATMPTVEKVTPESGAPGVSIAMTGSGLQTVSTVRFGPTVVPVVAKSDHFVQVVAPPRDAAVAVGDPVTIILDAKEGAAVCQFSYTA